MKVFVTGRKEKLGKNTVYVKKLMISGDRPFYLDIENEGDGFKCFEFIYPQNEAKIRERQIDDLIVKFGPATGRIYCLGSSKPIPRSMISRKLSACKKIIAEQLKRRDLRTSSNLDFGIKTIRKSLNIDDDS